MLPLQSSGDSIFGLGGLPLFADFTRWLYPMAWPIVGGIVAILALFVPYFLLVGTFPKVAAMARVAALKGWTDPFFWLLVAAASSGLVLLVFIPYNTFGEDIKMYKESALTGIMIVSTLLAVWTASQSIADELEGRTALTLLSKPISRRHFVIGKFLGVLAPVFTIFVILGVVFLCAVPYKHHYDARETSHPEPTKEECTAEMKNIAPALALSFMGVVVLTSIGIAISTRLPIIPNLMLMVMIYALGHITPLIVQSQEGIGRNPIVQAIGRVFAAVLPVLDYFDLQAAISSGREAPLSYLAMAGVYALVYCAIALLLSLILFEDRDLA